MHDSTIPKRTPGVLEERLGDEVVVVHPGDGAAYALSGAAARVWQRAAADGSTPGIGGAGASDGDGLDPAEVAAVASLVESGLLQGRRPAVSRRAVLRTGGSVVGAGVLMLTLPAVEAAASDASIKPAALTYNCVNSGTTVNPAAQATKQTLTVGPSTSPRRITFSVISAGGGGGGASSKNSYTGATSTQQTNPGNGGNGGFITGTITLPASTTADTISVYVGCGATPFERTTAANGTTPASTIDTSFAGYGDGYGGKGYGTASYLKAADGTVTSGQSGSAASGGGASALVFSGDSSSPSIVAGAGGGGGAGGTTAQTVVPNGGSGGGVGAGTAGSGGSASGGGAGTVAADGAAGTTSGSSVPQASAAGTGPNTSPGGSGGQGGVVGSGTATTGSTLIGDGGGGGAGYTGGGGGGATVTTTTVVTGGGGGGAGFAAATATSTNGTATIAVTSSGTVSGAPGGTGFGVGGAAVPANANTPYGPSSASQPGQILISSPGGFTIANA